VDRLEGHVLRRDPPDVEGLRGGLAEDRGEELVGRLVVDRIERPRVHHRRGLVELRLGVLVQDSVLGEYRPELGVHVLDVRLLARRGRVAEEHPRPDLAVPVRLDERVVVEDHVAVGEDGREELPEEGGADLPLDRVEEGLHLALGRVLDQVEEREGRARHRQDQHLLARGVGLAEEVHLEVVGDAVGVAVDHPVGVEVSRPVDGIRVPVGVSVGERASFPLLEARLAREVDVPDGEDPGGDAAVGRLLAASDGVFVGEERVVDALPPHDDGLMQSLVHGLELPRRHVRAGPGLREPLPRGGVGLVGQVVPVVERASSLPGAAVAAERPSFLDGAAERREPRAGPHRLARGASQAAFPPAACVVDRAADPVLAAPAGRAVVEPGRGFPPVPHHLPGDRRRVHPQRGGDLPGRLLAPDHPRKRLPFRKVELLPFVLSHN
jgi:hypothetical protein